MNTDIRHLLEKYFEGETSREEEQKLRQYFAQEELPEEVKAYAPIFRFIDDESAALAVLNEIRQENHTPTRRRPLLSRNLRSIAAVAATLLIAVLLLTRPEKRSSALDESYVWVDGKQISDPATVDKYAESSFEKVQPENEIVEDQLRFMLE